MGRRNRQRYGMKVEAGSTGCYGNILKKYDILRIRIMETVRRILKSCLMWSLSHYPGLPKLRLNPEQMLE